MGALAIDIDLLKQIKLNLAIFEETLYFLSVARLLVAKLIARECQDAEA